MAPSRYILLIPVEESGSEYERRYETIALSSDEPFPIFNSREHIDNPVYSTSGHNQSKLHWLQFYHK